MDSSFARRGFFDAKVLKRTRRGCDRSALAPGKRHTEYHGDYYS